jgi:hypothetical protein
MGFAKSHSERQRSDGMEQPSAGIPPVPPLTRDGVLRINMA